MSTTQSGSTEPGQTAGGSHYLRTTLTTATDALRTEEVERTRAFLRMGWGLGIGVFVLALAIPGDRRIATALLSLVGIGMLASVWLYAELSDPNRFDARKLSALALWCVLCGQLGILYVGQFSAAPLFTVLGLYFFCRTESIAAATAIYVLAAGGHGLVAGLVIAGVIRDPGLYPVRHATSLPAQIAGQLTLQWGYLLGFLMARYGRRASLEAISELQEATRLAAQRAEQVNELRHELDRALKIGGPGRFTGHTVGSWVLDNVLGRGAMGEVYEATHTTTGDPGAVKLLRRELLGASDYVERFLREVRAASSLESPHVVRVLQASTPEDPVPFLAMERLRGEPLNELLRKKARLAPQRLETLVEHVAGVLELARDAGIVHRDIKPQNLFHTDDAGWKLLDFGVAQLGEGSGTLTHGGVVGTPAYMAPEQAKGDQVDHRADVYALGAVIYRSVTGQAPFTGRDMASVLYMVVHHMPLRPGAITAVPPAFEAVLAIALAKSRDLRFQTAAELATAFAQAQRAALPDELRQRARAILREHPWAEPIDEDTKLFAAQRRVVSP